MMRLGSALMQTPSPARYWRIYDYPKNHFRSKFVAALSAMSTAEPVRIERRCGHRFSQFQVPVALRSADGRSGSGFTLDLSSHGALLWTDFPASENQLIEMTLVLPSEITLTEAMSVRCSARVLRLEAHRKGDRPAVAVKIESYEYLPRQLARPRIAPSHAHGD